MHIHYTITYTRPSISSTRHEMAMSGRRRNSRQLLLHTILYVTMTLYTPHSHEHTHDNNTTTTTNNNNNDNNNYIHIYIYMYTRIRRVSLVMHMSCVLYNYNVLQHNCDKVKAYAS